MDFLRSLPNYYSQANFHFMDDVRFECIYDNKKLTLWHGKEAMATSCTANLRSGVTWPSMLHPGGSQSVYFINAYFTMKSAEAIS